MPEKSSKKKPTTEAELRRVLKALVKALKAHHYNALGLTALGRDREQRLIARAEAL